MGAERVWAGRVFHLCAVVVLVFVLMNYLVAVISNKYANLGKIRKGLHSKNIINALPHYSLHKRFGFMIAAIPPFNLLTLLVVPIAFCLSEKQQKRFNQLICGMIYLPGATLLTLSIICVNLILAPFAYLKVLLYKIVLLVRTC